MRKMDYNGIVLCKFQANLFKNFMKYASCSPSVFIRRFMNSMVAKRFDDLEVLRENISFVSVFNELDQQYGLTAFGDPNKVDPEILYWTGYLYRYWSYTREISSSLLYQKLKPEELFKRYYLYHSMDMDYVIERIIEEKELSFPEVNEKRTLEQILADFVEYYKDK